MSTENLSSQVSIETILCLPHNQYRFKYKINDGSFHFIDKYLAFEFFQKYLSDSTKYKKLQTLLHSFLPFVIMPKINDIFELVKNNFINESRSSLDKLTELELVKMKRLIDSETSGERIPNDDFKESLENEILKKNL